MRRSKQTRPPAKPRTTRRAGARLPHRPVLDTDPEDPSQQLDDTGEFHVDPLAVEAQPESERLEDFDIASAENVEGESEPAEPATADTYAEIAQETGEAYGVRTPHAGDADLTGPEDRDGFEGASSGETWLEALGERATEMGPHPEEGVVIHDDSDVEHPEHRGHQPSDRRDRPVADKGSGGPGGL